MSNLGWPSIWSIHLLWTPISCIYLVFCCQYSCRSANGINLQIFFYKPNLWWPNGMGKQSLYNVHITVDVKGYGESDAWSNLFGLRKIESHIDSATGGRYFFMHIIHKWPSFPHPPCPCFMVAFYNKHPTFVSIFDIMICILYIFYIKVVQGQRAAYFYSWW